MHLGIHGYTNPCWWIDNHPPIWVYIQLLTNKTSWKLLDGPLGTQRGWQSQKLSIGLAEHWPTSLVGSDVQCMDMHIYIFIILHLTILEYICTIIRHRWPLPSIVVWIVIVQSTNRANITQHLNGWDHQLVELHQPRPKTYPIRFCWLATRDY